MEGAIVLILGLSFIILPWSMWIVWSGVIRVRQSSLLAMMDIAAQRGIPLDTAIAAFAEAHHGRFRRKVLAFARLLREGVSLTTALNKVKHLLTLRAVATTEVGELTGDVATAIQLARGSEDRHHECTSQFMIRICYLFIVATIIQGVVAFNMYWIIPKFKAIFADFGIELPPITKWLIAASDVMVDSGILVVFSLASVVAVLIAPAAMVGPLFGFPMLQPEFFENWFARSHCGTVLRCMALCMQQGRSLPSALTILSDHYPVPRIRRRLQAAVRYMSNGESWVSSLKRAGVIRTAEAELLQAAQRSDHLVWAMNEIAEGSDRRFYYRLDMAVQFLGPIVIMLLAAPVALTAIALFLPLVELIHDMVPFG